MAGQGKKRLRVWGARGQFSERDADAFAIRKIREWWRYENQITEKAAASFPFEHVRYLFSLQYQGDD